jgi:hypothetical protein
MDKDLADTIILILERYNELAHRTGSLKDKDLSKLALETCARNPDLREAMEMRKWVLEQKVIELTQQIQEQR